MQIHSKLEDVAMEDVKRELQYALRDCGQPQNDLDSAQDLLLQLPHHTSTQMAALHEARQALARARSAIKAAQRALMNAVCAQEQESERSDGNATDPDC